MNEIIKVSADGGTVSARELYERLKIKTKFTTWFERMVDYGFTEGEEFFPKMGETSETGGRPLKDYEISLDMAKQICMIQRTPEGKEVRQYLIDLEKAWNTPEQIMARALRVADQTIANLTTQMLELTEKVEKMQPKITYLDNILSSTDSMLVTQIAQDYGMTARAFNKILYEQGIQHKVGEQWILYSKYQGEGYVQSHTYTFEKCDGRHGSRVNTVWTQKGRLFLYELLKDAGIVPVMEVEGN